MLAHSKSQPCLPIRAAQQKDRLRVRLGHMDPDSSQAGLSSCRYAVSQSDYVSASIHYNLRRLAVIRCTTDCSTASSDAAGFRQLQPCVRAFSPQLASLV